LQAEKELLRLREAARLFFEQHRGMNTPFAVVVEEFLGSYVGRRCHDDFFNELHWFMGADSRTLADGECRTGHDRRNRPNGGRFGMPCKSWPLHRIIATVVEKYLRRRQAAGLSAFHAFVTIRTLLNCSSSSLLGLGLPCFA
jgi:hypothetical protein